MPFPVAWREAAEPVLLDRSGPPLFGVGDRATLFVGPEGGWSPRELELAGERRRRLGALNLRADTAALVGLTLALAGPSSPRAAGGSRRGGRSARPPTAPPPAPRAEDHF